jgi:galactokinase
MFCVENKILRSAHIVGENERVLKGKELLSSHPEEGLVAFGKLMFESHDSSKNFFENSCAELDQVVNDAKGEKVKKRGKILIG